MDYKTALVTIIGAGCIAATGCRSTPPTKTTFYTGNPAAILSEENNKGLRHALRLAPDEQIQNSVCKDTRYSSSEELSCAFQTDKRTLRLDANRWDKHGFTGGTLTVNPKGGKCDSYLSLHKWEGKYSMSTAANGAKTRIEKDDPLYGQFEERMETRFNELTGAMYNMQTGAAAYGISGRQQQIDGALGASAPAKKTAAKSAEKTLEDALK